MTIQTSASHTRELSAGVTAENAVYRKLLWRLMPLLMLLYVVAFIDRSNVGFAKLSFLHDLGLSEAVFGIGAGIFYAGYMLFEIPSNMLLAKIGARKTFLRIMVLWAVCSAGLAAMTGQNSYYLWRFLLGASEAGLFPGILLYLTFWVPVSRRARFTALFMASIPIAGIIGGPLSGFIMHTMDGVAGLRSWRWLFLIEGIPPLLLVFVVFRLLHDTPAKAPWLSSDEAAIIERDLRADGEATRSTEHKSFAQALLSPRFYLLTGMGVALLASTSNVFFWLPTIINRTGVTDIATIGVLSSLPFIAGFVCQYFVARHSDARKERRWHAALSGVAAAIGWAALPLVSSNPTLSVAALVVTAAGTFAATGPFWSMPSLYLSKQAAAGGIALISTLAGLGSLVSPGIVGWLNESTHTLAAGQYYLAALMLIGAVTVIAIGPHGRPGKTHGT
ncbi:d-galactonate transporter [Caballeronia choica]|uniref:D-galactonate transporter n=1 Tax=Caballeronia choica TaxID=326476 RepID=A0A158K596_9BURK|nr:MFS transporter [Caballeronia choica]SAL76282.1 d-galactonate transporter [Caballeronia choica]